MAAVRLLAYPVVGAFVLAAGMIGGGVALLLAGESLEAQVQNEVNSDSAACAVENCTALAPANQWPQYQQGESFAADGTVMTLVGIASVAAASWLARRPPTVGRPG